MQRPSPSAPRRPRALRLIISYKFLKGPLVLVLAALLSFAPGQVLGLEHHLAAQLLEWGALFHRLSAWLNLHVTAAALHAGAPFAWLDGLTTVLEGFALRLGYAWGEWLVVAGAGALIPFELWTLTREPSPLKAAVLVANVAIAVYLVRRRLAHAR